MEDRRIFFHLLFLIVVCLLLISIPSLRHRQQVIFGDIIFWTQFFLPKGDLSLGNFDCFLTFPPSTQQPPSAARRKLDRTEDNSQLEEFVLRMIDQTGETLSSKHFTPLLKVNLLPRERNMQVFHARSPILWQAFSTHHAKPLTS